MKIIDGGVCAAKGVKASGVHCGIRKNKAKKDLALIYSEKKADAAAVRSPMMVPSRKPIAMRTMDARTDCQKSAVTAKRRSS